MGNPLSAGSFVLFDTEFTAWEGSWQRKWSGPCEHRELIQLSAVRVQRWGASVRSAAQNPPRQRRDKELVVVDEVKITVRPVINPCLSGYITELTGITNEEVTRDGVCFLDAMAQFEQFCGAGGSSAECAAVGSFGGDEDVLLENIDLAAQRGTMGGEQFVAWLHAFHDVIPFFEACGVDRSRFSSGTLYRAFGIHTPPEIEARVHDSLWDVTSIFLCLKLLDDASACGWEWQIV